MRDETVVCWLPWWLQATYRRSGVSAINVRRLHYLVAKDQLNVDKTDGQKTTYWYEVPALLRVNSIIQFMLALFLHLRAGHTIS